MRELNEFSCISEGGMIRERTKQRLSEILSDHDIQCKSNHSEVCENREDGVKKITYDLIGDGFLIEIGRWEYWDKSLSDLLYKNQVAGMRFKVLILYLSDQMHGSKSKYNYSQAPAFKQIKQSARLQGVSVLNADEKDYIKLAESIINKIPKAKC